MDIAESYDWPGILGKILIALLILVVTWIVRLGFVGLYAAFAIAVVRIWHDHGPTSIRPYLAGMLGAHLVLLAVVHALSAAAAVNTQAARAADLAALAAADTARGLAPGDPCTHAEEAAQRNQSVLEDCVVGGDLPGEVRVHVSRTTEVGVLTRVLPLPPLRAGSTARAGPPEALPAR